MGQQLKVSSLASDCKVALKPACVDPLFAALSPVTYHGIAATIKSRIKEKSSGKSWRTLLVYDGWNTGLAFVNFDFTKFTDTHGVFFWK